MGHSDAHSTLRWAPSAGQDHHSPIDLRDILAGYNRRYPEFLSALHDHTAGERDLVKLTRSTRQGHRTIKDLHLFERSQQALPRALGLTQQVSRSSRCFLTHLCRAAIAADSSLTQLKIIPAMALTR